MASNIRSTYQAQLPFQHLYTNSKQQILAKYWIESVLGYRLPSNDLSCLKDGIILYKIIQALISHHFLPTDYQVKSNAQQPQERIELFQAAAKDIGLQPSEIFSFEDLVEENMDAVASTILILAYLYSYKRLITDTTKSSTQRNIIDTLNLTIPNEKHISLHKSPNSLLKSNLSTTFNSYNTSHVTASKVNAINTNEHTNSVNILEQKDMNVEAYLLRKGIGEQESRNTACKQSRQNLSAFSEISGMSRSTSTPGYSNSTSKDLFQNCDLSKMKAANRRNSMSAFIRSDRVWGEMSCNIPRPTSSSFSNSDVVCLPFDITNINIKDVEEDFVPMHFSNSPSSLSSTASSIDREFLYDDDEGEIYYDTKKSQTPSSSGDSGYGTTRRKVQQQQQKQRREQQQKHEDSILNNSNEQHQAKKNKAQDLFEALFTPPVPTQPLSNTISQQKKQTNMITNRHLKDLPQVPTAIKLTKSISSKHSISSSNSNNSSKKLSLLFSKNRSQHSSFSQKKKEPHFVKFQSWSSTGSRNNITVTENCKSQVLITSNSTEVNVGKTRQQEEEFLNRLHQKIESQAVDTNSILIPGLVKREQEKPNNSNRKRTTTDEQQRRESILMPLNSVSATRNNNYAHSNGNSGGVRIRSTSFNAPSSAYAESPNDYRSLSSVSLHSTISSSLSKTDVNNLIEQCDNEGQLMARYKLGDIIGKGHFGTVYRALDLLSGKTVAIKRISLQKARSTDIQDTLQEASLLSSLMHPNIVKYEGFIKTHEHLNIVLEYVENGSLLHSLKQYGHALPEHLVARYCYDILQGLVYLHEKDVVHCDLKAANILTTKSGDVKLSDFGVSLNLKLKKQEDNIVPGTPFWMAPEVIELKGASVKSDIWSLGCTLIELCTGKPPYADLLTMTAMFKIVEDESPPLPVGLSDELRDFLQLCFRKDPSERPQASVLLQHMWIRKNEKVPGSILSKVTSKESSILTRTTSTAPSLPPSDEFDVASNTSTIVLNSGSSNIVTSTTDDRHKDRKKVNTLSAFLSNSPYASSKMATSEISSHQSTRKSESSVSAHRFTIRVSKAKPSQQRGSNRSSNNFEDSSNCRSNAHKSMPVIESSFSLEKTKSTKQHHKHSMIRVSFPQGEEVCNICREKMYDALMCNDGCGLMRHSECSNRAIQDSETRQLMPPSIKPTTSVSSQLRQLFRPKSSKTKSLHHYDLGNIQEHDQIKMGNQMDVKNSKKARPKTNSTINTTSNNSSSRSSWWRKPLTSSAK